MTCVVVHRTSKLGKQAGFTYLWLLGAVAVMGIGLVAAADLWSATARRHKLAQLEWAGQQYVRAIASYHGSAPLGSYPQTLQQLLDDRRSVRLQRHLRSLYSNPFTGLPDWTLVSSSNAGIVGVRAQFTDGGKMVVKEYVYVSAAEDPPSPVGPLR